MANVDAAFGFRPVNLDGSAYSAASRRVVIATTSTAATFVGDPVKLAGGNSINGYARVQQSAAGDATLGVITSFEVNPDNLSLQHRAAKTQRFAQMVVAEGNKYFEVQSDDAVTALVEDDVGFNANYVVAAGSTVTGFSGVELDSSGATTTSTLDLQIIALVDREDNLHSGTGSANKNVIVKFNDPQTKPFRLGV